jgi:hypothetical protein
MVCHPWGFAAPVWSVLHQPSLPVVNEIFASTFQLVLHLDHLVLASAAWCPNQQWSLTWYYTKERMPASLDSLAILFQVETKMCQICLEYAGYAQYAKPMQTMQAIGPPSARRHQYLFWSGT